MQEQPPCPEHQHASTGICERCDRFCCPQCYAPGERVCSLCSTTSTDQIGDPATASFSWIVNQQNWFSGLLKGTLCMLGGIFILPSFALTGYQLRIAHQAMADPKRPLPSWDGFFSLVGYGFRHALCLFLPGVATSLLLLTCVGSVIGVAFASGMRGPELIPLTALFFYPLQFGIPVLMSAVIPAINIEFILTDDVFAAFHFRSLWRHVSEDFGNYIVLVLLGMAFRWVALIIGLFTCCLGLLVSWPWAEFTWFYYLGLHLAKGYPNAARVADLGMRAEIGG